MIVCKVFLQVSFFLLQVLMQILEIFYDLHFVYLFKDQKLVMGCKF